MKTLPVPLISIKSLLWGICSVLILGAMSLQSANAVRWKARLAGSDESWLVDVTSRNQSGITHYTVTVVGDEDLTNDVLRLVTPAHSFSRTSDNGYSLSGGNWASAFCASDITSSLQSHLSSQISNVQSGLTSRDIVVQGFRGPSLVPEVGMTYGYVASLPTGYGSCVDPEIPFTLLKPPYQIVDEDVQIDPMGILVGSQRSPVFSAQLYSTSRAEQGYLTIYYRFSNRKCQLVRVILHLADGRQLELDRVSN